MDLSQPENLTNVLRSLTTNDTNVIKEAEKLLKNFSKHPASAMFLIQQLSTCPDLVVRQQAALYLKRKISKFYTKYTPDQQNQLKSTILQLLVNEPEISVSNAISSVVANVAKAVFNANQPWDELFQNITTLTSNQNEKLRLLGFRLLYELAETITVQLKPHLKFLSQIYVGGCRDPNTKVAEEALSAATNLILEIQDGPELMNLEVVIEPMLTVMQNTLQAGDDESQLLHEALTVIQELTSLKQPIVNDYITNIVQFCMGIISNNAICSSLRQAAAETVITILNFRPKLFAKQNLVPQTLNILMDMIAKEDASAAGSLFSYMPSDNNILKDEEDDDEYNEEHEVQKNAQMIIDVMAIHIPAKYFVDQVLSLISQGMSSPDPKMRKAGCAVLGVIAEGCSDAIRQNLSNILPPLLTLIRDPEYYVRECACFALGQFSEYCQPDILYYNEQVLPAIFSALDDPKPTVQGTSCYVLEYFCENLQPETLSPYLEQLMAKLHNMLRTASTKNIQEMVLSAIAATAVASEIKFLPYVAMICEELNKFLFITDPSLFNLRGRSLECLGHIAIAIGAENFARYFEMGMTSAHEGLKLNDENLKEHSYVFIANSVKVMGSKFVPFLGDLIPLLLSVVQESELVQVGGNSDVEEDEEEEEDENLLQDYQLNVMEGFVNSKKAALTALGAIAEHTEGAFVQFIEPVLETLITADIGSLYSLHENIRAESASILQHFVKAACDHLKISAPSKNVRVELPPVLATMTQNIMIALLNILETDEDKLPVAEACNSIVGILNYLGVSVLYMNDATNQPLANSLMKHISTFLNEKGVCQVATKRDTDDEDDEANNNIVIEAVSDVIGALARCLGSEFEPYFDQFLKPLLKFTNASRSHSDRSMAVGCFSEVLNEMGEKSIKYSDVVFPVITVGLQDSMETVRRNAAYCLGVLVQSTGTALQSSFPAMLQALYPLCNRKDKQRISYDSGGADVDNALASVARILNQDKGSTIPLQSVLPVMLDNLPLRNDITEGPVVYGSLIHLLEIKNQAAIDLIPRILPLIMDLFSPDAKTTEETLIVCVRGLKWLKTVNEAVPIIQSYLSNVQNPEHVASLQNALA